MGRDLSRQGSVEPERWREGGKVVSVGTNRQVERLFLSSWSTAVSPTQQCRCVVGAEASAEWLEESEGDHPLSRQNCVRCCPDIVPVPVPALTMPCCPSRGLGWTNPAHEQYDPPTPHGAGTLPPVLTCFQAIPPFPLGDPALVWLPDSTWVCGPPSPFPEASCLPVCPPTSLHCLFTLLYSP